MGGEHHSLARTLTVMLLGMYIFNGKYKLMNPLSNVVADSIQLPIQRNSRECIIVFVIV